MPKRRSQQIWRAIGSATDATGGTEALLLQILSCSNFQAGHRGFVTLAELIDICEPSGTRTRDPVIKSHMLYRPELTAHKQQMTIIAGPCADWKGPQPAADGSRLQHLYC